MTEGLCEEIDRLREENARLREVLQDVLDTSLDYREDYDMPPLPIYFDAALEKARKALEGK